MLFHELTQARSKPRGTRYARHSSHGGTAEASRYLDPRPFVISKKTPSCPPVGNATSSGASHDVGLVSIAVGIELLQVGRHQDPLRHREVSLLVLRHDREGGHCMSREARRFSIMNTVELPHCLLSQLALLVVDDARAQCEDVHAFIAHLISQAPCHPIECSLGTEDGNGLQRHVLLSSMARYVDDETLATAQARQKEQGQGSMVESTHSGTFLEVAHGLLEDRGAREIVIEYGDRRRIVDAQVELAMVLVDELGQCVILGSLCMVHVCRNTLAAELRESIDQLVDGGLDMLIGGLLRSGATGDIDNAARLCNDLRDALPEAAAGSSHNADLPHQQPGLSGGHNPSGLNERLSWNHRRWGGVAGCEVLARLRQHRVLGL
mmetsp:Transcript_88240/g.189383  ORF Transcript_88240/g.189383 Transcript_88240/m.189383 type:complete len:379 (-) Transcript_88240:1147-2283(-)